MLRRNILEQGLKIETLILTDDMTPSSNRANFPRDPVKTIPRISKLFNIM
jgi:hypothetical protein